jgi:6-phosphogluconolactonase
MDTLVMVGTYTVRGSEGIYTYRMDRSDGSLSAIGVTPAGPNPSFLAVDREQRHLYAVNEVEAWEGEPGGRVRAFELDRPTGSLRPLGHRSTRGPGPCHLAVDRTGRCVVVSNYSGGSVVSYPVQPDGALGAAATFVQHPAPSSPAGRQDGPHAHCAVLDPGNQYVLVPDLGLNRLMTYRLEAATGRLAAHDPPWTDLHPGAGPRHAVFHPNGRFLYAIDELDSTISVLAYPGAGVLERVDHVSTLPAGWTGENTCADIHFSPDGRYLYGSNRGHDSIAIYSVDGPTGALRTLGHVMTRGRCPRNFAVGASFLYVANQDSDRVVCFARDPETGGLSPTGIVHHVPCPVCVIILEPPEGPGAPAGHDP